MGMHGGFIVTHCGWLDLRRVLEDHCGPLAEDGTVPQAAWSRLPRGEAVLHVGVHKGRMHRRPDADDWKPAVVRRGSGSYDIRGWTPKR